MLRLPAQVDHPYRISIDAARDDATIAATITDPAGAVTVPVLALDGEVWSSQLTPTLLGDHTVTITASDNPDLVGLAFVIVVGRITPGDLVIDHAVVDPACGVEKPVRWPCPYLRGLPCIDAYDFESIEPWMGMASQTIFLDTASRFPGCHWYARLRPRISGACLCIVPGTGLYGFDLFHTIRYPALELLEVEIDGGVQDLTNWRIEQKRYLAPADGQSWPSQNWDGDLGSVGTWSVLVRYGRAAPALVARARDLFAYSLILDTEPTSAGDIACRLPDGTTQLSENGRVIQMDVAAAGGALHEQLIKRWGGSPWNLTQLSDPAEFTSSGSRIARIVPGDQTPLSHSTFLQSGCDLAQEIADLTP